MITEIYLENFKLFAKPTYIKGLKNFNLLTGINGSGKSTSLQPLLLFNQTLMRNTSGSDVFLNGDLVRLGLSGDVKNVDSNNATPIRFGFSVDNEKFSYSLSSNADNRQILKISSLNFTFNEESLDIPIISETNMINLCPEIIFKPNRTLPYVDLTYIAADRVGPKLQYEVSHRKNWIGPRGEFTPQVLFENKDLIKPEEFFKGISKMFPNDNIDEIDHSIIGLTQYWLSKMFGETTIDVQYNDDANLYTIKMSTQKNGVSKRFKPTNIGFGYSYALPIIVAGLTASAGSILIIENPESHLHPSAQSIITRFLNHIASNGVQVFVETHSEHILNALRVLAIQSCLNVEDVNVFYFSDEYEEYFKSIELYPNGELKEWPSNFFDQNEKDLNIILGF